MIGASGVDPIGEEIPPSGNWASAEFMANKRNNADNTQMNSGRGEMRTSTMFHIENVLFFILNAKFSDSLRWCNLRSQLARTSCIHLQKPNEHVYRQLRHVLDVQHNIRIYNVSS